MTASAERPRPEILETLTAGIAELTSSEAWRRYLDVQRRFYRYSFANTLLISLQRPDATHVAGFHAWRKLGRHVLAGERGIAILAPCIYPSRRGQEATDDPSDETPGRVLRGFRVVHVFDPLSRESPGRAIVVDDQQPTAWGGAEEGTLG